MRGEDGGIKGNGLIWDENSVETRRSPGNRDFAGGLTSALPVKPPRIVPLQRFPFVRSRAHTKLPSPPPPSLQPLYPLFRLADRRNATWPANPTFHPSDALLFQSPKAFFLLLHDSHATVRVRIIESKLGHIEMRTFVNLRLHSRNRKKKENEMKFLVWISLSIWRRNIKTIFNFL